MNLVTKSAIGIGLLVAAGALQVWVMRDIAQKETTRIVQITRLLPTPLPDYVNVYVWGYETPQGEWQEELCLRNPDRQTWTCRVNPARLRIIEEEGIDHVD